MGNRQKMFPKHVGNIPLLLGNLFPLLLLVFVSSLPITNAVRIEEKVCIGTNGRMSVPSNREHHYRNLRDRYTNCTYVDGNLELTWLQDENLDLSFLQHIREVTGYVLISHVDVTRIVLPSLQIIRGRTLFKLSVHEDEFALMVTLSKMHNLELPALRDILEGSVGMLNNYNLCHIKTINWKEIITGQNAKYMYVYKFQEAERDCTPCNSACEAGCWGEGAKNCQKFSKTNCSPQCHKGRCFGPQPRECCHLFCAGGCTGPKQSDCLACRNFYDDGVCKQECPPMQRYNPIKYKWEKNPDGKYAYGATCVRDCPKHLLKDNGACVRVCPPNKKTVNGECVPCNGPCPKICHFNGNAGKGIIHDGNINSLLNCTVIEGSLTILDSSFNGFQEIYDNFTFGPRYPPMSPSRLEILSSVKEITGYLNIQAHHENFTNLNAFRNLEIIGGRHLTEYFSSLYIVKTSLSSLNMRKLQHIRSGSVAVLENSELCYAQDINWQKIMQSTSHNTLLQNNRPKPKCLSETKICDSQCSDDGCWGPGKGMCLACKAFSVGNECVASCDPNLGLYKNLTNNIICEKCDSECQLTCSGPGADSCDDCKHTKDGPFCVKECPNGKYDANGECKPCHDNCVGGCKGPQNTVGPNGCHSCEKSLFFGNKINNKTTIDKCLAENEACPDGFYLEVISRHSAEKDLNNLKLEGKAACKKCHPLCKKCTGFGFHKEVCDVCMNYIQNDQCVQKCSDGHYVNKANNTCLPCHSECRDCYGPTSNNCNACKNFKLYKNQYDVGQNGTEFNCTKTCPDDFPHKVQYPAEAHQDPYCSSEPVKVPTAAAEMFPTIIGGIVGSIVLLGLFLVVFSYQWRQRARAKERTTKMTMLMTGSGDDEPLKPSDIKPNLAKFHTVKETELRKGNILGYGAFGTVFRGVWIPEAEKQQPVKIPVAIKVLKESSDPTQRQQILEEAYMMAALDHPHLLKLLATCLATHELMLVFPLMPLGCLLDYVRKNKEKIGSAALLTWCTQIAKGMAYLEEKRLVHRDLAARNVLVQNPKQVKITDFGLAKFLDVNEYQYKAQGGKMPIKWLALECIQQRVFTHKSDVWAFGVTVWELMEYGGKPYDGVNARDVPDLLEKGERLPQPSICTIDLYYILLKCWQAIPDNRPTFKQLVENFVLFARDPGRYLVIPGDKLMRLPSYTTHDEKELLKMNVGMVGNVSEMAAIMGAEEYLNPGLKQLPSQHTLNTPVDTPLPPNTPSQKLQQQFFPSSMSMDMDSHRNSTMIPNRHSRYGSSADINGFSTLGTTRSYRTANFNNFSTSCDPLKDLVCDENDGTMSSMPTTTTAPVHSTMHSQRTSTIPRPPAVPVTLTGLNYSMPVDDEQYLLPSSSSPHSKNTPTNNNNPYMELVGDTTNQNGFGGQQQPPSMFQYPPPPYLVDHPSNYGRGPDQQSILPSMDNPEYIWNSNNSTKASDYHQIHTLGIPLRTSGSPASSQGPSSIHSVTSNGPPNSGNNLHPSSLASSGSAGGGRNHSSGLNGVVNNRGHNSGHYGGSNPISPNDMENSSPHEYYNDFDRLKPLKLQPPPKKNETTV